jgi:hypothetical protein
MNSNETKNKTQTTAGSPAMKSQFRIWCEVWGGVTGSRAAWFKCNEAIHNFLTREAAQKEADRLNADRATDTRASYRYTVREIEAAR